MSGNLNEIRAYNRLAKMARGELLVLLQDDDLPMPHPGFLGQLRSLFKRNPDLALVGGLSGVRGLRFRGF